MLGVVLYEMLCGIRPFFGETWEDLADEIEKREPKPPRQTSEGDCVPAELERICLRCLCKAKTGRYHTAGDVSRRLRKWLRARRRFRGTTAGRLREVYDPAAKSGVLLLGLDGRQRSLFAAFARAGRFGCSLQIVAAAAFLVIVTFYFSRHAVREVAVSLLPPLPEARIPEKPTPPVSRPDKDQQPKKDLEPRVKRDDQPVTAGIPNGDREARVSEKPTPPVSRLNKDQQPKKDLEPRVKRDDQPANAGIPNGNHEIRKWLPITLPSGAAVTEAMLSVPKNWLDNLFPETANVFPVWYGPKKLQGVFTLDGVRLHGAAATLHRNGSLATLVTDYSEGLRDGCIKLWDDKRRQILYAEYRRVRKRDEKQGIACLFQDGIPWFVQVCDKGKPQYEYLVKWTQAGPLPRSAGQLRGDEIAEMSKASRQLADLEHEMKHNETQIQRKLANYIAGISSQGKLASTLERIHRNGAARSAEANAFWRSALSRSGF